MNRYGKGIGVFIGLVVLAALVFYIVPKIGSLLSAHSNDQTDAPAVSEDEDAAIFENFLSDLNASPQYTFCAVRSTTGVTDSYSDVMYCTVKGNDYVIQLEKDKEVYRQIYVDGEYTLVNDTEKTVYKNTQEIDFPDTHFREAVTGKIIGTQGEIINGNQVVGVQLYKNGTVYMFYFDQTGELIRYYYIYNNNEITIDFCNFVMGFTDGISFSVSPSFEQDYNIPCL